MTDHRLIFQISQMRCILYCLMDCLKYCPKGTLYIMASVHISVQNQWNFFFVHLLVFLWNKKRPTTIIFWDHAVCTSADVTDEVRKLTNKRGSIKSWWPWINYIFQMYIDGTVHVGFGPIGSCPNLVQPSSGDLLEVGPTLRHVFTAPLLMTPCHAKDMHLSSSYMCPHHFLMCNEIMSYRIMQCECIFHRWLTCIHDGPLMFIIKTSSP